VLKKNEHCNGNNWTCSHDKTNDVPVKQIVIVMCELFSSQITFKLDFARMLVVERRKLWKQIKRMGTIPFDSVRSIVLLLSNNEHYLTSDVLVGVLQLGECLLFFSPTMNTVCSDALVGVLQLGECGTGVTFAPSCPFCQARMLMSSLSK